MPNRLSQKRKSNVNGLLLTFPSDTARQCTQHSCVVPPEVSINIAPAALPAAEEGVAYSQALTSDGTPPLTWSLTDAPGGLTIDADGVLTWPEPAPGEHTFTVNVEDDEGRTASIEYTLTVDAQAELTIEPTALPDGTEGTAYSQTVTASGGTEPYTWSATDAPAGLTVDGGVVSWDAPTAGAHSFTVNVQDADGRTASIEYTLTIEEVQQAPLLFSVVAGDLHVHLPAGSVVDWGDGSAPETSDGSPLQHTYDGPYNGSIAVVADERAEWNAVAGEALLEISDWGEALPSQFALSIVDFQGPLSVLSGQLTTLPSIAPPGVTDLSYFLVGINALDPEAPPAVFNQDISGWDVSGVTNMAYMFYFAPYNQPLGAWDVSSVTDMNNMFANAPNFNQPLDAWDTSAVQNMEQMFVLAAAFDQPLNNWDVSSVTSMRQMFSGTPFNGDITGWDTGNVSDMSLMFSNASAFDQDISGWDVSGVTDMDFMFFSNASEEASFNQDLSAWCVEQFAEEPNGFSTNTDDHWTLPKPNWGAPC